VGLGRYSSSLLCLKGEWWRGAGHQSKDQLLTAGGGWMMVNFHLGVFAFGTMEKKRSSWLAVAMRVAITMRL